MCYMKRFLVSTITVGLPALAIVVAAPSKPASIQGAWRTVEVTLPGPNGRTITNTQPNLTIVTQKHYSRVEVHADNPRPVVADVAKATADELRAAWGPFVAEAGTYEVSGNVITMRPTVSKNPAAMGPGSFSKYSYRMAGDTIWITPQSTDKGPIADPMKIKAVRAE
jgi:hypothetical protein